HRTVPQGGGADPGVVENMGLHVCTNCGHEEHVFGEGGAERVSREYGVELLGTLPLDASIRQLSDAGTPIVAAQPESRAAGIYGQIAARVREQLGSMARPGAPNISVSDD